MRLIELVDRLPTRLLRDTALTLKRAHLADEASVAVMISDARGMR